MVSICLSKFEIISRWPNGRRYVERLQMVARGSRWPLNGFQGVQSSQAPARASKDLSRCQKVSRCSNDLLLIPAVFKNSHIFEVFFFQTCQGPSWSFIEYPTFSLSSEMHGTSWMVHSFLLWASSEICVAPKNYAPSGKKFVLKWIRDLQMCVISETSCRFNEGFR